MSEIINIWDFIVKSNAFNFIVMILLLGYIFKKVNLEAALENIKKQIIEAIENSKLEKAKAELELKKAQKAVENLDSEIKERFELAEKNVQGVVEQTLENAKLQAEHIEKNVFTAIENEEKQVSAKILNSTAVKALETAKDKIISRLKDHPELHEKFINEAIDDIDKVKV